MLFKLHQTVILKDLDPYSASDPGILKYVGQEFEVCLVNPSQRLLTNIRCIPGVPYYGITHHSGLCVFAAECLLKPLAPANTIVGWVDLIDVWVPEYHH